MIALLRTLLLTAISTVVLWLAAVVLIVIAGAWSNERRADAILVLGAAQYIGRPSPVLQARLDHALDLYERGLARRIIFTGGVGRGDTLSEAEVARRYARRKGVPDDAILIERGVSSAESMSAAATVMEGHGMRSAIIVSDSYHMLRLELLARRAGIRAYRSPVPDAPIDRARRAYVRYVLRESVLFPVTAIVRGR